MTDALLLYFCVKFLGFNEQVNSSWILPFVECYFCGIICAQIQLILVIIVVNRA